MVRLRPSAFSMNSSIGASFFNPTALMLLMMCCSNDMQSRMDSAWAPRRGAWPRQEVFRLRWGFSLSLWAMTFSALSEPPVRPLRNESISLKNGDCFGPRPTRPACNTAMVRHPSMNAPICGALFNGKGNELHMSSPGGSPLAHDSRPGVGQQVREPGLLREQAQERGNPEAAGLAVAVTVYGVYVCHHAFRSIPA